jgi:hypothetical protein
MPKKGFRTFTGDEIRMPKKGFRTFTVNEEFYDLLVQRSGSQSIASLIEEYWNYSYDVGKIKASLKKRPQTVRMLPDDIQILKMGIFKE